MTCYTYGRDRNLPVIVWIRGTKVNSYYTYYTASIWFTVFAMVIMLVAVGINPAMDESHRRVTRLLFVMIILSSLCEWTGNMLDNAPVQLIWLHRLVKLVELSVAPSDRARSFISMWTASSRSTIPTATKRVTSACAWSPSACGMSMA